MGRGQRCSRCRASRSWSASTSRRTRATTHMSRSSSQCRSREGQRQILKQYIPADVHSLAKSHILYPIQVCEEVFEKKCQITFNQEARNETVKMCHRPTEIRCDGRVNNRVNNDQDTCRQEISGFDIQQTILKGTTLIINPSSGLLPRASARRGTSKKAAGTTLQRTPGVKRCQQRSAAEVNVGLPKGKKNVMKRFVYFYTCIF